ncbi:MAG: 1-acyl-sn-glycerol-3-phosphate acyltransferase [Piscirickettsiaceae bacterium CG_4_9_14_3_um_filter_43_564]|nr:1-acyl-sn-glycerol-3-phosphate acyltransferase [Thiomicrospira sp.]OIP96316.1 MAG: 1-acyl-sn-glycerol-3-phosphate acyltransferase [Thiomicrospira sp. CG2_30_44_34]PIQ04507.1 MAG: 1-acyl-sn-glycerol-3-phosphate acyltransferase [Piscirickettsiaceae bacterium CG18_big_fil_WC_8_21_14_2_50_44_103]PIU38707.1 MAG: 1-acyl-sn-glycerol-3-phosphate acyltransferase [Piscirickettsiaceae bacterium CG07_land_8_20_14_0_80_44_28]PIW58093.1 MAG: 1-acyl-sn-glycerol-3-phosphate acyltransferase [Piscirickettsiac
MKFWYFLRSLVFSFGQMVTLVFFSLFGLLLAPFSHQVRYRFIHYWARFCIWWLRWTCGVQYRVFGAENIDLSKAGLVFARHESAWETFAFQAIFPQLTFVLKKELLKIPFFGWGLAMLSPIAIDRKAGRKAIKQVVTEGCQRIDKGVWVVIFPEGTRMPAGVPGQIKSGGAMLAKKAQAPVYLVAHNAGSCWPKNSFIKTPGTIDVYISPPLDVTELTVADINQKTEEWLFEPHTPPKQEGF